VLPILAHVTERNGVTEGHAKHLLTLGIVQDNGLAQMKKPDSISWAIVSRAG
jgi:hypothetical protein